MNTFLTLARCGVFAAALVFSGAASAQNLLNNPDFNGNIDPWGVFGAAGSTNFFGQNTEAAFFSDNAGNFGGIFQDVSGTAGLNYTFTILAMRIETNTNPTISYGIEFRGAGDALISVVSSAIDYGAVTRNENTYSPASVSGVAPIGTVAARAIISYADTASGSNFFYVFNTEMTASAVPEPSSFAVFAGLGALGCVALRRRHRV